jgi:hypothetical protein
MVPALIVDCVNEIETRGLNERCIKDFLRNLGELLIPYSLWTTFSNAAQQIRSDDSENNNRPIKSWKLKEVTILLL